MAGEERSHGLGCSPDFSNREQPGGSRVVLCSVEVEKQPGAAWRADAPRGRCIIRRGDSFASVPSRHCRARRRARGCAAGGACGACNHQAGRASRRRPSRRRLPARATCGPRPRRRSRPPPRRRSARPSAARRGSGVLVEERSARDERPEDPEALRAQLQKQLEARIDRDVAQITAAPRRGDRAPHDVRRRDAARGARDARGAAAPRRAQVGARARAVRRALQGVGGEARRSARARARAELPAVARSLRARAQGLPVVRPVRSRALRRRLPRERAGQAGRGARALQPHPQGVSRARASSPTRTWRAPSRSSTASTTTPARSPNTKRSSSSSRASSTASRSSRARGACGASGAATRPRSASSASSRSPTRRAQGERRAAQAARRAPGRGAQVPRRGLHRGREEHRAGRLRLPHEDRRRPVRGQDRARARACSSTIRRTTSAASRPTSSCSKLEPDEPRRRRAGCSRSRRATTPIEDWPKLTRDLRPRRRPATPPAAPWAKTQGDPDGRRGDDGARSRSSSREHALQLHAKAQKDKTSRAEFEGAAGLYDVYLSQVRGETDAYQIQYYLAEIYFYHLDKHDRRRDALHGGRARRCPKAEAETEPLKTLRHDALYNAIAALERVRFAELEARKKSRKAARSRRPRPTRSSPRRSSSTRSSIRTIRRSPSSSSARASCTTTTASTTRRCRLGLAPREVPAQPVRARAPASSSSTRSIARRTTRTSRRGRAASRRAPAFAGDANQKKLDTLIVQAVFKQGEQKAAGGRSRATRRRRTCARRRSSRRTRARRRPASTPSSRRRRRATSTTLKEARAARHRQGLPRQARVAAGRVDRGDDVPVDGPLRRVGRVPRGDRGLADREHPHYQKYEHAKDAAYNAVVLRVATGEHDKAIANGNRFLAQYGTIDRRRRGRLPDGQGPPERGPQQGGRRPLSPLPRALEEPGPPRAGLRAARDRARRRTATNAAPTTRSKAAVDIGKHRKGELGPDGKYAAAHARYMEGERVLAQFDADPDPGRREAALGAPEAEGRAPQAGVDGVPRRRLARRRRVDDGGALPDRPHLRDVRQGAARRAAAVGPLRRRQGGVPARRSTSSSSRSRSAASTRTRTAGRRRSSSASTTSGRRRCARRSGA